MAIPETRMPVYERPSVSIPISSLIFGTSSALLGKQRVSSCRDYCHNWRLTIKESPHETARSFIHYPKCRKAKRSKPESCTGQSINTFQPNAKSSDLARAAQSNQSGKTKYVGDSVRHKIRDSLSTAELLNRANGHAFDSQQPPTKTDERLTASHRDKYTRIDPIRC